MKFVADLEVHSKYARAVSPQMNVPTIAGWAAKKGIDLVGTGDFTHPMWLRELEGNLEEAGEGIYQLKVQNEKSKVKFLLTSEISCIYSHNGKGRRVHILVYLPTFTDVEKFNKELISKGANLFSDGRPIVGLTLSQIVETALGVQAKAIIIPAHVWTPWFGFYGSMSGYDHLEEAFGELAKYIPAVETGLSSDPAMNWKIGELTNRRIVSFSDAHSPAKLGREATVFDLSEISFNALNNAIWGKGADKIDYTIEFYPEEGKYHYTGHRNCKVVYSPNETRKMGTICPVCGRTLTVGVASRVEELGKEEIETESSVDKFGVRWIKDKSKMKPGYVMLVPLLEILSEALDSGVGSKTVLLEYDKLINTLGSEFKVLLETKLADIEKVAGSKVMEGISKVRSGDIVIEPGYDGVFGKVRIWKGEAEVPEAKEAIDQGALF
ncbi:hypothetical protein A2210_00305 [Candidatus Woesebacteria bacterium RIFOXYA1_FULL_40_18]|uniref:And RNA helicase protein n=3 Tax=Candidatus Woeseibacteriota TaxID=1752722 RepID=A0A0G0SFE0_9BACT|nr:MAG: and RNA helicase protein [Candidatus Woesebacteria bacterium GW2011_GWA1_40_45]OGM75525.1 MAG: hypothetical protein A2210_00305 [Candidatus Woesebacteria bacterium RIFOXYA1_FULL_40_18]OGM81489.1 MAG: hypothetical protein A2361_02365 [Candidatus Woesebacteria bacterium RIFOXYB1_FULL_40_26]